MRAMPDDRLPTRAPSALAGASMWVYEGDLQVSPLGRGTALLNHRDEAGRYGTVGLEDVLPLGTHRVRITMTTLDSSSGATQPTLVSMLEDLETHSAHPAAVLAIIDDLRRLLGLPDRRDRISSDPPGAHA